MGENEVLIVKFKWSRFCLSLEVVVGDIEYMDDGLGLYKDGGKTLMACIIRKVTR